VQQKTKEQKMAAALAGSRQKKKVRGNWPLLTSVVGRAFFLTPVHFGGSLSGRAEVEQGQDERED
jgi:hypothetical protein